MSKQNPGSFTVIIVPVLAAALLLAAAGCGGEKQDPAYGEGAPKQDGSPPQISGDAPRQAAGDFPFLFTEESYECKVLDKAGGHNLRMLQGTNGILHAVYADLEAHLYYRKFDGRAWSEPEIIETTDAYGSFHLSLMPAGDPRVAYVQHGMRTSVHIAGKAGGKWEENEFDVGFKEQSGEFLVDENSAFAIDSRGNPLFLYARGYQDFGYYLNDMRLTERLSRECTDQYGLPAFEDYDAGILPGLGGDIIRPKLTVSPNGRYYLDYLSFDYEIDTGEKIYKVYKYLYSISADGGETWEGPFEACGDASPEVRSTLYGEDGTKYVFLANNLRFSSDLDLPKIVFVEISPAGETKASGLFIPSEIEAKIKTDYRYYEIQALDFAGMFLASDGTPYLYGDGNGSKCLFRQDEDGVWQIISLGIDDGEYTLLGIALDADGAFMPYGRRWGQGDELLYWQKIK